MEKDNKLEFDKKMEKKKKSNEQVEHHRLEKLKKLRGERRKYEKEI
jgi:hypothetical protein